MGRQYTSRRGASPDDIARFPEPRQDHGRCLAQTRGRDESIRPVAFGECLLISERRRAATERRPEESSECHSQRPAMNRSRVLDLRGRLPRSTDFRAREPPPDLRPVWAQAPSRSLCAAPHQNKPGIGKRPDELRLAVNAGGSTHNRPYLDITRTDEHGVLHWHLRQPVDESARRSVTSASQAPKEAVLKPLPRKRRRSSDSDQSCHGVPAKHILAIGKGRLGRGNHGELVSEE